MATRWYIGLSSGASRLGVNAALVRVEGVGLEFTLHLERWAHFAFPRELRELLVHSAKATARQIGWIHRGLGEAYASAVRQLFDGGKPVPPNLLAIGCSGQLFSHDPLGRLPSTLTLGMPAVLAERTGLSVLSDFRTRDVLMGGLGCPITPLIDARLFRDPKESRILIDLGGWASIVHLPPGSDWREVVGFQAVPCGILLDGLMRLLTGGKEAFDAGGKHAVQGKVVEPLIERWLDLPEFQKAPPRYLAEEAFGNEFLTSAIDFVRSSQGNLHDLLCSATHFIARGIIRAMDRFLAKPWDRVLVSGGGCRNGFLWHLLEQQLTNVIVQKTDNLAIPAEARKAVGFAGLTALAMDNVPGNLPSSTGASSARVLGQWTPGSPANWSRCVSWMANHVSSLRLAA